MALRSQRLRLLDIAEQIDSIEHSVAELPPGAFATNWLVRSAVERGMEVISEASRHIQSALIENYPDVPWRRVADIGNWLRHAYDRVDPELIWVIVVDHLPVLKNAVADMLARQPQD